MIFPSIAGNQETMIFTLSVSTKMLFFMQWTENIPWNIFMPRGCTFASPNVFFTVRVTVIYWKIYQVQENVDGNIQMFFQVKPIQREASFTNFFFFNFYNLLLLNRCLWLNWGSELGAIAPPSRKRLLYLQEHKNKIILYVLPYVNFCPAIEKCCYLLIF